MKTGLRIDLIKKLDPGFHESTRRINLEKLKNIFKILIFHIKNKKNQYKYKAIHIVNNKV